jgi:hypothetical protein
MNKLKTIFIVIVLIVLSFYCTNKEIENLKNKDTLMQEIKNNKEKYIYKSKNAIVNKDTIIPGEKGIDIDYNKSYYEMKKYGTYNEALTVMKEVTPDISIDNNYDKYIVRGNKNKKEVGLIFKLNNETNPNKIIDILENKNVYATFFIDGTYLENNIQTIRQLRKHELEILSYDNSFNKSIIKTTMSYLETITKKETLYCYTETKNNDILDTCKKMKKHTIIPNYVIKKDLYKTIKNNLDNSLMITIEINNYNELELPPTIDYIKSKGYSIVPLYKLLSED